MVDDARSVLKAIIAAPELCAVAGGSGLSREQARELLHGCFKGRVAEEITTLFEILLDRGRLSDARDILQEVVDLADQQAGKLDVEITTAVVMEGDAKAKLEDALKRQHGNAISFVYAVDSSLIAGIKIAVDGTVFDATAARQLAAMKQEILAAPLVSSWEE